MADYAAPVRDMQFVINEMIGCDEIENEYNQPDCINWDLDFLEEHFRLHDVDFPTREDGEDEDDFRDRLEEYAEEHDN